MSAVGHVAAWAPGPLTTAQARVAVADALVSDAGSVLATQAGLAANWSGEAAQAAAAQHAELSARLDGLGDAVHRLGPALERAADRLALLVAMVRLTEVASLEGGSALVGRDGPRESAAAVAMADEIDAELAAAFAEVIGRLDSLTEPLSRSTGSPGSAGSAASGGWAGVSPLLEPAAGPRADARLGTAVLLTAVPSPPPGGDLVAWWDGLSAAQRESAVDHLPEIVGPKDGLPGWARDRANRILLDRAETALIAEVATLEPRARTWRDLLDGAGGLDGAVTIGTFGGGTRRLAYQQAVAKLAAVRATRQVLDQRDGRTRQLLAVDVTGRTARVAVAVGDVDRAAHVAVVVPGFTTTVERDLTGADRVSADLADQSSRAATLVGDHRDVAVVSWLGYDIPQTADTVRSGHSVVLRASAEAGAGGLATFLRGLPSDQHVTLVGHSYGSTTAGLAVARGDTGVDDLVVLGSPGLGADTSTELGLPPRHVHVLEADEDPVADLGWFGRDPSGLPGVDRLSTDNVELPDGRTGRRSVGHSGYLVPGTTSQWNVAAVVAGAPVVREGRPPPSW
jgi:uncharacterized protein YukE